VGGEKVSFGKWPWQVNTTYLRSARNDVRRGPNRIVVVVVVFVERFR